MNKLLDHKINLGFLPTPLQKLNRLSEMNRNYQLFIKRDDQTGLASGGNKTRKLEYLLQDAIKNGCDTIITAGAQQSNHCRQTAAACALVGLDCHLLLGGEAPLNIEGNLLLSILTGAKVHYAGDDRKGNGLSELEAKLNSRGKKCYVIPYGGSNFIGALGFVNAMKELNHQLIEKGVEMDYIFFASSSGGTQAGMTLGKEMYNISSILIPINIDKADMGAQSLQNKVLEIVNEGSPLLGIKRKFAKEDIFVDSNYDQTGYGVLTNHEKKAIHLLASKEGIFVDPVYTGRAFYAMLNSLQNGTIRKGSNVLFWHTGGFPTIFKHDNELI